MRDIIHIGYPRTATTWFQNNVFSSIQNYTFIPRKLVRKNLFLPLPEMYSNNWPAELRENNKPLLISEEMISGKVRAGSINLYMLDIYAQRINATFNDPLIVIFLRRQPDIIYSFYNLYIKKGGTYPFSKFIRQDLNLQESMLFSKSFFCYDIPLQILSKTFGKENIKVYLFEEFSENPPAFINRICNELGLQLDTDSIIYTKVNSGYSTTQRRIKQFSNRFTSQGIPFKHYYFNLPYVYQLFKNAESEQSKIPTHFLKQIEGFLPDFVLSNRKVAEDYGLQIMKDFNYPI